MEVINYGVIEGKRDSDYVAGTLVYEERNPSGDWTSYLPPGEWQRNSVIDTQACVTFSCLNSLEMQYKFLTGQERNFSDRFTAKMSGTTQQGNYLWKVADSVRLEGVVDESVWPAPENFDWDAYYIPPSPEVINKALESLNEISVQYEWVDINKDSLIYHLKHAPLQIIIPGHAVVEFLNNDDVEKYFDSYAPFVKDRTQILSWALKIVLSVKKKTMTKKEVEQLQALEGYHDPVGVEYWTGKSLTDYLVARLADKIKTIQEVQ